jgi:hypothetical protein
MIVVVGRTSTSIVFLPTVIIRTSGFTGALSFSIIASG